MAETKSNPKAGRTPMGPDAEDPATPAADEWGDDQAVFLPSWDFGKPFIGTILASRIVEGVIGLGGVPRDVSLFTVLSGEDGDQYSVWGSGMLERVLPTHVGHRVKIADKGLEPCGDGTSLRIFDVRCATCTASQHVGA